MKLPPKPKKIREQDGYKNPNEWDKWGRACAEAMREECAKVADAQAFAIRSCDDSHAGALRAKPFEFLASCVRSIKIEEE